MSRILRSRALPLAALAAVSLLLTSCAGGAAAEEGTETRTVTSEAGESQVPVDPQRIVALDEASALNLLSIGVTPDVVFDSWRTTVPKQILESEGIEFATTSSFYPELEEVAALEPDLIVATYAEGMSSGGPTYSEIAPVIGGLYDNASGQEIALAYGEYFDRADEAEAVVAALDALTEEVAASQPEDGVSLSALMSWAQDNMPLYMDEANTLHDAIADAGFTRPALQDEIPSGGSAFGGWSPFSAEELTGQDADVLAVAVAAQYNLEGITDLPLYDSLGAVERDRSVVVDGDFWSGGSAFYTYWVLNDLRTFTGDDPAPGDAASADARWSDYRAAIEG